MDKDSSGEVEKSADYKAWEDPKSSLEGGQVLDLLEARVDVSQSILR